MIYLNVSQYYYITSYLNIDCYYPKFSSYRAVAIREERRIQTDVKVVSK